MASHALFPTFTAVLTILLLQCLVYSKKVYASLDCLTEFRSDHGGENVEVWQYMLQTHNDDPHCVLTGSSTHNERIERLWRDVHQGVLHFADTFRDQELDGILDT